MFSGGDGAIGEVGGQVKEHGGGVERYGVGVVSTRNNTVEGVPQLCTTVTCIIATVRHSAGLRGGEEVRGRGVGPGTNCLKIHLISFLFSHIFPFFFSQIYLNFFK